MRLTSSIVPILEVHLTIVNALGGGFWVFIAAMTTFIAAYGLYRMTQRATVARDETSPYQAVSPRLTPVAAEMAQEVVIEQMEAAEDEREEASPA